MLVVLPLWEIFCGRPYSIAQNLTLSKLLLQENANLHIRSNNNLNADSITVGAGTELYAEYWIVSDQTFGVCASTLTAEHTSTIEVLNTELMTLAFECDTVILDGELTAGVLTSYAMLEEFRTGDSSAVTFTPESQSILVGETMVLGGQVTLNALMNFDEWVSLEIASGATVTMNEETDSSGEITIQVNNIANIAGTFNPPVSVNFDTGTPDFIVSGTFRFDDASAFKADRLEVSGVFACDTPLDLSGQGNTKIENIVIADGGTYLNVYNSALHVFSALTYRAI